MSHATALQGQAPSRFDGTTFGLYVTTVLRWGVSWIGMKAQVGVETWGSGVLGVDTTTAPILLPGATFFRAYLEVGLGSFRFYYDRMNLLGTEQTYVPGFVIPRSGSTYGVRWTFVN